MEFNQEKIEMAYLQARQQGVAHPTILLSVPSEGFVTKDIQARFTGQAYEKLQRKYTNMQRGDVCPTFILALETAEAIEVLEAYQTFLARADCRNPATSQVVEGLKVPAPEGMFPVFTIAGGKQLAYARIPDEALLPSTPDGSHSQSGK